MGHDDESDISEEARNWKAPKTGEGAALVKKGEGGGESVDPIQETIDGLNHYLREAQEEKKLMGPLAFGDVRVSVQAGSTHYCNPRENGAEAYDEVELGYPNVPPPDYIMEHAEDPNKPTETVYAYVPIEKVARWIREKGGSKSLPEGRKALPEPKDE